MVASPPQPRNLVEEWTAALKSKPVIAAGIVAAVALGGLAAGLKSVQTIRDSVKGITQNLVRPELVSFTLSPNAAGFEQVNSFLFGVGPTRYLTFEPVHGTTERPEAIFLVTIKNPTDKALIITKVDYEVEQVGQVMGGESGPLQSLATYHHTIEHFTGVQEQPLSPPFRIAAHDAASFELQLVSATEGPGLGWFMRTVFITDAGDIESPSFQLFLPQRPVQGAVAPPPEVHNPIVRSQDLMNVQRPLPELPPVDIRDCDFQMAGLANEIAGMDQMDRDLLFANAAEEAPDEFAQRYSSLSPEKRDRLQTIVKSRIGCQHPQ